MKKGHPALAGWLVVREERKGGDALLGHWTIVFCRQPLDVFGARQFKHRDG